MQAELIPYATTAAMIQTWDTVNARLKEAFDTIHDVDRQLRLVFDDRSFLPWDLTRSADYQKVKKEMLSLAWSAIIDKTEIRKMLSLADIKKMEDDIRDGNIGELSMENILSVFRSAAANIPNMQRRTVEEVFDLLRPHMPGYVRNQEFSGALGKRMALPYWVERRWSGKGFAPRSNRGDYFRQLDKAFHLLDGKPMPDSSTYYGPLADAISASPDGVGETPYYSFRCYKNCNLHLTFKRMDLVQKMNAMCAGKTLSKGAR